MKSDIQTGQTLIETLIALAVAVIVISAAAVLTRSSLNNSQTSKDQNLATQYAQEALDLARLDRNAPATNSVTYCVDGSAVDLSSQQQTSCAGGNVGQKLEYKREVILNPIDANSVCGANSYQVRSVVSWNDGKCTTSNQFCRKVELTTCLAEN